MYRRVFSKLTAVFLLSLLCIHPAWAARQTLNGATSANINGSGQGDGVSFTGQGSGTEATLTIPSGDLYASVTTDGNGYGNMVFQDSSVVYGVLGSNSFRLHTITIAGDNTKTVHVGGGVFANLVDITNGGSFYNTGSDYRWPVTTPIRFSSDGTINYGAQSWQTGNISTTVANHGTILTASDVKINNDIGSNSLPIKAITISGSTQFLGNVYAQTTTLNSAFELASGKTWGGNITSSSGVGTIILDGNNTISGSLSRTTALYELFVSGDSQIGSNSSSSYGLSTNNLQLGASALTVYGDGANVALTGDGLYSIAINNSSDYGYVELVSAEPGSFTVSGDLVVSVSGLANAAHGDRLRIVRGGVDSLTSIDGEISIIKDEESVRVTPIMSGDEIILLIATRNTFNAPVGGTQAAVSSALDSVPAPTGSDLSNVLTVINTLPATEANSAYAQLAPSKISGVTAQISGSVNTQVSNVVSAHLGSGVNGGDTLHRFMNQEGGIWFRALGARSRQSEIDGVAYKDRMSGGLFGVDALWNSALRLGAVLGYSNNNVNLRDHSSEQDIKSIRAGIYGSRDFAPYYVEGLAISTWSHYRQVRSIIFSGVSRKALSDYNGKQNTFSLALGKKLDYRGWKISPKGAIRYSQGYLGAYAEGGASDLNLSINRQDVDALQSDIGLSVHHAWKTQWVKWTPEFRLKWTHDYLPMTQTTSSSFVAGGATFLVNGPHSPRSLYSLGIGLTALVRDHAQLVIDYDRDIKARYRAHNGSITARYQF